MKTKNITPRIKLMEMWKFVKNSKRLSSSGRILHKAVARRTSNIGTDIGYVGSLAKGVDNFNFLQNRRGVYSSSKRAFETVYYVMCLVDRR